MSAGTPAGHTWPEQQAAERWWNTHRLELQDAMTAYRIEQQEQLGHATDALNSSLALVELLRRDGALAGNHYGALKATLEAGIANGKGAS